MPMGSSEYSLRSPHRAEVELIARALSTSCFALSRAGVQSAWLGRGPMRPSPPAPETATARSAPARARIGAATTRGVVVHGNRVAKIFARLKYPRAILCVFDIYSIH